MNSGSQTHGPHVDREGILCSPLTLFGNFEIINIQVILFIHWCLKVLGQRVNKLILNQLCPTQMAY